MKKAIFILIAFFAFSGIASAQITFNPSTPVLGQTFDLLCSTGNMHILFIQGQAVAQGNDACPYYELGDLLPPATYFNGTFIECDNTIPNASCVATETTTIQDARNDAGYISERHLVVGETDLQRNGILYSRTDGKSDAGLLVASVATATGETTGSIGPIVAIILGIILAFVFIRTIIGLIYETRHKDTKKE